MKAKQSYLQSQIARTGGRKSEAGQSLVLVALSLVALLGMAGMAIDMGFLRFQKGRMQAAADAAALAAGAELQYADLTTAAQNAAAANGYTDGSNGVSVTVNHPPTTGSHSGNASYVEVIISQNQPTHFMGLLGVTSMPLSARSVGTGLATYCIYGLASTGTSLQIDTANVTANCGVVGNSNLASLSSPHTLNAPYVGLAGTNTGSVTVTPAANTGISTVADPFSTLPAPTNTDVACATHPSKIANTYATTTTLSPGTYCGGINITGGVITFNPGIYYLNGGGISMTAGTGEKLLGTGGVTFYNSGTGVGSCNTCYGAINMVYATGSNLTSPGTSGTYEGILFYQDPLNTQQATFNVATGVAAGTVSTLGVYYFPTATVELEYDFGNVSSGFNTLVANTVWWKGTGGGGTTFHDDDDFSHDTDGDPNRRRRGRLGGS